MAEKQACTEIATNIKAERKTEQQSKAEIKTKTKKVVIETDANEESDTESEYEEVEVVEEVTDDSSAEGEEEDGEEEEEAAEEEEEVEEKEQEEKSEEKKGNSEESDEENDEDEKPVKLKTAETAKLDETKKSEIDAKPKISNETPTEKPKVDKDELSKEQEAKEQSKLIILPLLQGLLQKQNSQSNNINNSSGNDLETNYSQSSEKPKLTQKETMSSKRSENVGLQVHHVEDSGTESGEDLKFIAAGLRDSLQMHSIQNQSENELITEVTSALNRLESSLREGKDLKLDAKKRNALLSLVARLQTGLISPDKITAPTPAPGQTADGDNELSSPDGDNRKYPRTGHQRFAKRRNRANRHTVGVSREELADARRYIEEMVMMESISNRTTPDSGNIVSPPEYPVQKQSSCGAVLANDVQEPSTLFRPNQFVPDHLKEGKTEVVEKEKVQLREKKPKIEPSRQTYHFEQSNLQVEASRRPFSQMYPGEIGDSVQMDDQLSNTVEEKNFYNKTHHSAQGPVWQSIFSGMRPSAYQEAPAEVGKNSRFMNKKMMMKRANTIDIPKPIKYMNDMESDSDAEEHGVNSTKSIGLRGTVQVTVKNTPKSVVPPFKPKTENDLKFLAFIQKQNPGGGVVWNNNKNSQPGNPVKNWSNKFGNIKNAFEQGQMAISSKPPMPTGVSSTARNFWKKAETAQVKETRVSSSPKFSEKNAKVPPWSESQPTESPKLVVPKPIPVNKFSHAPMSVFKPISPTAPEKELAQFQPIKTEMYANPNVNGSFSEPRNMTSQKQTAQVSYHNQMSKPNQSPTLPWTTGRTATENRVQNIATAKFENRQPQRHNSARVENVMQQERVNGYNRLEQKRSSLPNTKEVDPNNLKAPQMVQDIMHAAIMKEFPPMTYTSTDYSQPSTYSTYVPEISLTCSDSLTNPAAEPLVLTNNRPFISPYDNTESLATSPNLTQNEVSDSEFDTDSITEYKAETKIMRGPVSQQAITISNRTMRRGDEGKFSKNSKEAKSLLSVMKNIKPTNTPPVTKDGRSYKAPKVESILPVNEEINRFSQGGTSPPVQQQSTLQGYNPIYQQLNYKPEQKTPKAPKQPVAYQAKPYVSSNTAPIAAPQVPTSPAEYKCRRTSIPDAYQATSLLQTTYPQDLPGAKRNPAYQAPAYNEQMYQLAQKSSTAQQPIVNGYHIPVPREDGLTKSAAGVHIPKPKITQQTFNQSSQQSISRNTQYMTTASAPTTPEKRVQPFSIPAKSQSNPSTPKEEPKMVFKKFGPPQPHHYMPNSYQYPLAEQPRKYSEPNVKTSHVSVSKKTIQTTALTNKFVAPKIVETPSSPRPLQKNEMPSHVIYNNVNRVSGYDPNTSITTSRFPVNPLSRSDSWHQIRQQQMQQHQQTNKQASYSESVSNGGFQLRRVKSGHSLEVPKMFEAGMKKAEIVEKQRTVAAYFSGEKSPISLSRNSSQTNIAETANMASSGVTVKKTSINRIRTTEKASISNQNPSTGLSRSQTMPHIASVNLLDESNVEDAFEELLKSS